MTRAISRQVCGHFATALEKYGAPEEILTDNGKVFTNRFGLTPTEVLFDRLCRDNGINHLLTAPFSPTTTGKIERFHRTLRHEFDGASLLIGPGGADVNSTNGSRTTTPSGPTRA